ncbi:MAG: ComF family protein, partial [Clostridia bacterium]|nr:ComF family protein [Clostridia bacterium]
MSIISSIKQKLIDTFYPKHIKCICCKDELSTKNVYDMCTHCYKTLPLIKYNFCVRCGLQFDKDGSGTCLNCKANNFSFELARSALNFDKAVVNFIHQFKYARYKFLAEPLSYLLYDTLILQDWKIDLISYVPLHPKREKDRGYNQSRELATNLSKLSNIEVFHNIE